MPEFDAIIKELVEKIEKSKTECTRDIDFQISSCEFDKAVATDAEVIQKISLELEDLNEKREMVLSKYPTLKDLEEIKEILKQYYTRKRIEVASEEEIQAQQSETLIQFQSKIDQLNVEIEKDGEALKELEHSNQTSSKEVLDVENQINQLKNKFLNELSSDERTSILSEAESLSGVKAKLEKKCSQEQKEVSKKSEDIKNHMNKTECQLKSLESYQKKISSFQNPNDYRKYLLGQASPFIDVETIEKNLIFWKLQANNELAKEVFNLLSNFYLKKQEHVEIDIGNGILEVYLFGSEINRLFPGIYDSGSMKIPLKDFPNLISYFKKIKGEFLKKQEKIQSIDCSQLPSWEWLEAHKWFKVPMTLPYEKDFLGYKFQPSQKLLEANYNLVEHKKRIIKNYDLRREIKNLGGEVYGYLSRELFVFVKNVINQTYFQGEKAPFSFESAPRLDASSIQENISYMLKYAAEIINAVNLLLTKMEDAQSLVVQNNRQLYEQLICTLQSSLGVSKECLAPFIQKFTNCYILYSEFHKAINTVFSEEQLNNREFDMHMKQNELLLSLIPYLDEKAHQNANHFSKSDLLSPIEQASARKRLLEDG